MIVRILVAVTAVSALGVLVPAAHAGTGGRWDRVGPADQFAGASVGRENTGGGIRVAHIERRGDSAFTLHTTDVNRRGRIGTRQVVFDGAYELTAPDLITSGDDWTLLFSAQPDANADGRSGVRAATSTTGGPWSVMPVPFAGQALTSHTAGEAGLDGTPFTAWNDDEMRSGRLVPRQPGFVVKDNLAVTRDVGVDGRSGRAFLVYADQDARDLKAQELGPTGAPVGAPLAVPMSSRYVASSDRQIVASEPGRAGVFVAYEGGAAVQDRALLWRVGSGDPLVVARRSIEPAHVIPARDAQGRVWVLWTRFSKNVIYARRSNRAVTRFGPTVTVRKPARLIWELSADASNDRLDIVPTSGSSGSGPPSVYHTQVTAPLTVRATPGRVRRSGGRIRVKVTDAGDPVRGARVRAAGVTRRTNSRGVARLRLRRLGARRLVRVTATDPDYGAGTDLVRVRR